MTDPKARARELAEAVASLISAKEDWQIGHIEYAILTFARELLAREPSDAMVRACDESHNDPEDYARNWELMAAELAKEL